LLAPPCWNEKPRARPETLPKIFHVNWFRKAAGGGGFLWPGFGENARVLDWVLRRVEGEPCAQDSAVGLIPRPGDINISGLKEAVDMEELFSLPKEFWQQEVAEVAQYLDEQVGEDLPYEVVEELESLQQRVDKL